MTIVSRETLGERVAAALDRASANGYFNEPGDDGAISVAVDLASYDADFNHTDPEDLVPYVEAWLKKRNELPAGWTEVEKGNYYEHETGALVYVSAAGAIQSIMAGQERPAPKWRARWGAEGVMLEPPFDSRNVAMEAIVRIVTLVHEAMDRPEAQRFEGDARLGFIAGRVLAGLGPDFRPKLSPVDITTIVRTMRRRQ